MNNTPTNAPLDAELDASMDSTRRDCHAALKNAVMEFLSAISVPTDELTGKPLPRHRAFRAWTVVSGLVRALYIDA